MIQKAVNVGSEVMFSVQIENEVLEWNYIQLGTYLVSNAKEIEFVKIVKRVD